MLQVKNLTLTHRKDLRTLVENLSFVLNPGDKAAIIGEEGNGKSTVLKWLANPALVEGYCQWSGEVTAKDGSMGYLAQELTGEERGWSVYRFCEAALSEADYREAAAIARQLGLDPGELYSERPMETLSGGERIKIQLETLLLRRPRVLLLDEPSSDLDLETLQWLERFIAGYPGIVLYISHDEALLERTANVILHLEHPREGEPPRHTVARLGYAEYAARRLHAIAVQTRQANKEREEYEEKQARYQRIRQSVEHAQNTITRQDPGTGRLLKKKMHAVLSMGRRFEREAEEMTKPPKVEEEIFLRFPSDILLPPGKTVLDFSLEELRRGDRLLASGLRLRVMGGEKVGILGRNGAGKTTLLRCIAGELLKRKDLRAAYMPQDYADGLPLAQTPVEYLAPTGSREDTTRARTLLGSIRYTRQEMFHPIRELSGGQKAKLLLTRMILERAEVLILDEPTRNFSPLSGPHVRAALAAYGGSLLCVSHDRKFLREVCTTLYRLTEKGLNRVEREELEQ